MTIKEIIDNWPIGYRAGLPTLTVKKTKKKTQVEDAWYHQILLTDGTADILADVKLQNNVGLIRNQDIRGIICEVQNGENGKKLMIEQYSLPAQIGEPYDKDINFGGCTEAEWRVRENNIVRGKVRHGVVCAMIQRLQTGVIRFHLTSEQKEEIEELVNYIMTGQ